MKKLICLVGFPGSGKSTALEFAKEFGAVVVMGDVVRKEAQKKGIKITSESLGQIAKDLRKKGGPNVIADRTIITIKSLDDPIVFVDGIRSPNEYNYFCENFPKVILVSVDAPKEQRYKWMMERKREDDSLSLAELKARDAREVEFGVKKVMDLAEYQIANKGSVDDLKTECHDLFSSIIHQGGFDND